MVIKIKRGLFLKPRRCPDCGKVQIFVSAPLGERCKKCHNRNRRNKNRQRYRQDGTYKYGNRWQRVRKRVIRERPYCALCGATEELTVHHVGGGVSIIRCYAMSAIKNTKNVCKGDDVYAERQNERMVRGLHSCAGL